MSDLAKVLLVVGLVILSPLILIAMGILLSMLGGFVLSLWVIIIPIVIGIVIGYFMKR